MKQFFIQVIKTPNISLNELKLVEKGRIINGINGVKSMFKDRLLSNFGRK